MFYVVCPKCEALVYVPNDFDRRDRADVVSIARCLHCDQSFTYKSEQVNEVPDAN